MSTVLQITTAEIAIGAGITLLLGCLIGYALGLADFDRVSRRLHRQGPRA
jgi:hypothetical protein